MPAAAEASLVGLKAARGVLLLLQLTLGADGEGIVASGKAAEQRKAGGGGGGLT